MGGRSCPERSGRPASAGANSRRRSSTSCSRPSAAANARAWSRSAGGRRRMPGRGVPGERRRRSRRQEHAPTRGGSPRDPGRGRGRRRMPGRGRDQQAGGDMERERRCRQGRGRRHGALDTANARAWPRSAGRRGYGAGKAMPTRASPAAWRTRYGERPGVAEISRQGDLQRERRCRQGRARQRGALGRLGGRLEIVSGWAHSEMCGIAGM